MTSELNCLNRNSRAHMYNINNYYLCCLIIISNDCYKSHATSIPIISSVDWCVYMAVLYRYYGNICWSTPQLYKSILFKCMQDYKIFSPIISPDQLSHLPYCIQAKLEYIVKAQLVAVRGNMTPTRLRFNLWGDLVEMLSLMLNYLSVVSK